MTPATPPAASAAAPSAPSGQPAFSHAAAPGSASEPLLFIVSAPSGSGKSTLVREILRLIPDLEFSISYTTRPPRGSEVNGREYFFISREEFEKRIQSDAFLEYAEVFGYWYGTAWSFLEDARRRGRDLLLDIDVQGAAKVLARCPVATSIFIAPPNRETLEWRLRHRGQDPEAVMERRLRDASREIAAYNKYQYLVINDRLEDSVERLAAIIATEREARMGASADESGRQRRELARSCRQKESAQLLAPVLRSFGVEMEVDGQGS